MKLTAKFVLFMLLGFVAATSVPVFFFNQEKKQIIEATFEHEKDEVNNFAVSIENRFREFNADVEFLEKITSLGIAEGFDNWKDRIVLSFEAMAATRPFYSQIRYINKDGYEVVRINSDKDGVYVVKEEDLQDKSGRGYFQQGIKVLRGETYTSEMELNIEHGVIEVPHNPVLHFVRSVYAGDDLQGIVVINVDANIFLNPIRDLARGEEDEDVYLIDQDGFFLVYPRDASREFGKVTGTGDFSHHYFTHNSIIMSDITTVHIVDVQEGENSNGENIFIHRRIHYDALDPDKFFVLIEQLGTKEVLASAEAVFIKKLVSFLVVFVFVFVLFYFLFISPLIARILRNLSTVQSLARGDLSARSKVSGSDEVSNVATGINDMAKNLEVSQLNLKQQRDRLRTVFSSMPSSLLVLDRDYKISYINSATNKLFGMKSSQIVGKDFRKILKILNNERVVPVEESPIEDVFNTKKGVSIVGEDNIFFKVGSAEKFPVSVIIAPVLEKGSLSVLLLFSDISEQKTLSEMKSSFISKVTHQLRSPLGVMRWYSEALADDSIGKLNKTQKEFAQRIHERSMNLIEALNLLLFTTKVQGGYFKNITEKISVGDFVKTLMVDWGNSAKDKSLKLHLYVDEKLPMVNLSPAMLREALKNLVSNALRYTNEGGSISINVSSRDSEYILVTVKDDGIGIPEKEQGKIFGSFFRASNAVKKIADGGSGLGLALVAEFAKQWGGAVWFDSKEGEGSIFYLTIPVVVYKDKDK